MHLPMLVLKQQPHGLPLLSSMPCAKNRRKNGGLRSAHLFQAVKCSVTPTAAAGDDEGHGNPNAKVLILGATGRVGGSAARALSRHCPNLNLLLAGRNREKGERVVSEIKGNAQFVNVDIDDRAALESALNGIDLVVHAAGPFQRKEHCNVLEAAISNKVAYIDVCDDQDYARCIKGLHEKAKDANVPAITTAGIYPGVSNVMAAELVRLSMASELMPNTQRRPDFLRFSYFTAGSGGAGPTILSTSYLLLGEEVTVYRKGEKLQLKPYSGCLDVDFGKGVGRRSVYLLNLPEVATAHEVLGVPSVSARFGTAPAFWNWAMGAVATLAPPGFLKDRESVEILVGLTNPLVRLVDEIVGECVSMRVDFETTDEKKTVALFTHKKLSVSVGICISAFVRAVLEGSTQPGVWYPEEEGGIAIEARQLLLKRAAEGTINFVMNKSPWMIEAEPKQLGFGIYM